MQGERAASWFPPSDAVHVIFDVCVCVYKYIYIYAYIHVLYICIYTCTIYYIYICVYICITYARDVASAKP